MSKNILKKNNIKTKWKTDIIYLCKLHNILILKEKKI